MSAVTGNSKAGLALLNLSAWIRRQGWMRLIYRLFPQPLRSRLSGWLASRVSAGARFVRTENWNTWVPTQADISLEAQPNVDAAIGVNILGYMRGQFGLAESARMYARALKASGIPVALHDIDLNLPHGWNDHSVDRWLGEEMPYPVSVIFVNPDYLQPALEKIGKARLEGRYLIACWFWELERIPDEWLPALALVDEIMVASAFIEKAFRRVTDKPILRVPLPVAPGPDSGLQRADFGLEEGKFIFLTTFDFNSWIGRKNPVAAVQAFRLAFPGKRDDVRLVIKSSNGFRYPEKLGTLLNLAAPDSRIIIRDDLIDRAHISALQRCCDAYVSLHRAEGFGLGLAECMASGKPVVATGWSGNLEFMTPANSCLVDFRLVDVAEGEYPHPEGAQWAEPNINTAAIFMRRLVQDSAYRTALGNAARASVQHHLSSQRSAELLASRLSAITLSAARPGTPGAKRKVS